MTFDHQHTRVRGYAQVSRWDDKRIVALNPELREKLLEGHTEIQVGFRTGSSGTTEIVTKALKLFSENRGKSSTEANPLSPWPYGIVNTMPENVSHTLGSRAHGFKDSSSIAAFISSSVGGFALLSQADTIGHRMDVAKLINRNGNTVEPSIASINAALRDGVEISTPGNVPVITLDQQGSEAWPMVSLTYFIVRMSTTANCQVQLCFFRSSSNAA